MAASVAKSATTATGGLAGGAGAAASAAHMQHSALWLRSIESAIYSSLQVIQQKHEPHPARTVAGAIITLLQLCAFALSSRAGYSWRDSTVRPVQIITELTTIPGYTSWMTPNAYIGLYYAALVWVVLYTGLLVWAVASFTRKSWTVLWPLRLLEAMGAASATVLYIPLFYLLMSGFSCHLPLDNSFWLALGYTCYTGGHLAQAVISAMLTILFVAQCALFTLVYLDSNPLSANIAGKAHGRADLLLLLVKSALVVLVEVYPHSVGADALSGIVLATGVVLVGVYTWFMPFTHHVMNRLMLAVMTTFMWFGLRCVLAEAYPSVDAGIFLYVGGPLAAFAGCSVADWRAHSLFRSEMATLRSPYEVELKVRYFLHAAIWGHPTDESAMLQRNDGEAAESGDLHVAHRKQALGLGASAGSGGTERELEGDDCDGRVRQVRALLTQTTLKQAESLWKVGLARFKSSALLHILAARFYDVFCGNNHLQMSHFIRAERRNPAIDVRFFIFQARKAAEDGTSSKGQMSALNRVAFEKHLLDAKHNVHVALSRQSAFWGELANPSPDITRCHRVLAEMNRAMAAAERDFSQLLELNSQSLLVLRQYAEFTMYVVNNSEKANVLLAEAERLEEQQSKDHEREAGTMVRFLDVSNLDVMADNTAVVTIGGSHGNLGIITSVTPYATKLFGYSRWQMERRNISMLLPSPIAEAHDGYLSRYIDSGEGRVVDYTRVTFGLHRAGYIFPMLLSVREQPASDGPPAFIGIMRTLNTTENHILMRSDGVVAAASQASLVLLNVEPSTFAAGEAKITDWVAEWQAAVERLSSTKGTTLCFNTTQAQTQAALRSSSEANAQQQDDEVSAQERGALPLSHLLASAHTAGGDHQLDGSVTWVRAHLQHVPLPLGEHVLVLHWTHLPSGPYDVSLAERRRRELVEAATAGIGGNLLPVHAEAVDPQTPLPEWHHPVSHISTKKTLDAGNHRAASSCPAMRINVLSAGPDSPPAREGIPQALLAQVHAVANNSTVPALTRTPTFQLGVAGAKLGGSNRSVGTSESSQRNPTARDISPACSPSDGTYIGTDAGTGSPVPERNVAPQRSALKSSSTAAGPKRDREGGARNEDLAHARLDAVIELASPHEVSQDNSGDEAAPVMFHRTTVPRRKPGSIPTSSDAIGVASGESQPESVTAPHATEAATGSACAAGETRADPWAPAQSGLAVTHTQAVAWGQQHPSTAGKGISFSPEAGAPVEHGDRASHASSSRRSIGRKSQNRLRRSLAGDSQSLVMGLAWLRASGIVILLVTIVLAIAMAAVVHSAFTAYNSVLDGRVVATELLGDGVRATQHMRFLILCKREWVVCPPEEQVRRRGLVTSKATEFGEQLRGLYDSAQALGYQRSFESYDVHAATYSHTAAGTLVESFVNVSLLDAGLMLVAAAQKVATMPLGSIERGDVDMEFVVGNAFEGGAIHDAFNATIFSWMRESASMEDSVRSISVSVYVSMVCMVVVLALGVVLPILVYIDRARDRYLLPFIKLPPSIPQKLRANSERRLRLLRAADADAEEGDDSGSEEERCEEGEEQHDGGSVNGGGDGSTMGDETDWNALLHADAVRGRVSRQRKRTRASAASIASGSGSGLLAGAVEVPEGANHHQQRSFRKSPRMLLETIGKFVLPLLLVLGFFSVSYVVSTSTLHRVHVLQQFDAMASQRALLTIEIPMLIRAALGTRGLRTEIAHAFTSANRIMESLAYHHALMMFVGKPADVVVSDVPYNNALNVLSADAAEVAKEMLFGDACAVLSRLPSSVEQPLDYATCAAFRGGIMTHGVHGAVADFIALNKGMQARREAADVLLSQEDGTGRLFMGNTTMPYSLVTEQHSVALADSFVYGDQLLTPCLNFLAGQYTAATAADILFIQRFLVGIVTGFLLLFAGYQLLVYLPQVRRSNTEIKDERVVMLLLPGNLLQSVPQLLDVVATIVEAEEGGATV